MQVAWAAPRLARLDGQPFAAAEAPGRLHGSGRWSHAFATLLRSAISPSLLRGLARRPPREAREGAGAAPAPEDASAGWELRPVLNGHASSLPPVLNGRASSLSPY